MSEPTNPGPFQVKDCAALILSLGKSALSLRELRDHLTVVPVQSISHHFYESLMRPAFDDPEYRNDFAGWARHQLHDHQLAERLALVNPMDFPDTELLRQRLLDIIEDHLAEVPQVPRAARGQEFTFLRSQFVVLNTGLRAGTPDELATMIPRLSTGSIFYHFVEARRRTPLKIDDFSVWLQDWGDGWNGVRDRLSRVDFQVWSLTELRERIGVCFDGAAEADGEAA